jgi:uncharacterized OB-fold protein
MNNYTKPLPLITGLSKIFWDGCKQNKLLYQQCGDCGEIVFFPKMFCSNCMSHNLKWKESKGRGRIYQYTITYDFAPMEFMADVPYVLAIIDMQEGFRIMSNIVECEFDKLHSDMEVEVVFDRVTPEITLHKFRPVKG